MRGTALRVRLRTGATTAKPRAAEGSRSKARTPIRRRPTQRRPIRRWTITRSAIARAMPMASVRPSAGIRAKKCNPRDPLCGDVKPPPPPPPVAVSEKPFRRCSARATLDVFDRRRHGQLLPGEVGARTKPSPTTERGPNRGARELLPLRLRASGRLPLERHARVRGEHRGRRSSLEPRPPTAACRHPREIRRDEGASWLEPRLPGRRVGLDGFARSIASARELAGSPRRHVGRTRSRSARRVRRRVGSGAPVDVGKGQVDDPQRALGAQGGRQHERSERDQARLRRGAEGVGSRRHQPRDSRYRRRLQRRCEQPRRARPAHHRRSQERRVSQCARRRNRELSRQRARSVG